MKKTLTLVLGGVCMLLAVCKVDTNITGVQASEPHYPIAGISQVLVASETNYTPTAGVIDTVIVKTSAIVEEESGDIQQEQETPEPESDPSPIEVPSYTEEELYLLARLIRAEAGADWCSDTMQLYTGSVVLNRVASDYYPNDLYSVIYQKNPIQYQCVINGAINKEPDERSLEHARYLLENGSQLPENVIFQAEFKQGSGIYTTEQNMIFCYK